VKLRAVAWQFCGGVYGGPAMSEPILKPDWGCKCPHGSLAMGFPRATLRQQNINDKELVKTSKKILSIQHKSESFI
jgi:hypothetical protein